MRRFLPLLVLAPLSLAFAPAPLPRTDPSKEDLKGMQGTWIMTQKVCEGVPDPPLRFPFLAAVKGKRVTFHDDNPSSLA